MNIIKKETKPCPYCNFAIPRKNFKSEIFKCLDCGTIVCNNCSLLGYCINCGVTHNDSIPEYFNEKYSQGVVA